MKYVLVIALTILTGSVFSQQLTAHWSVDSCMIGEQVTLKIQLRKAPPKVNYQPYAAEVPCEVRIDSSELTQNGSLEIIGRFSDSTYKKNGQSVWEGRYTVTAWDTGVYVFPLIRIPVGDSIYLFQPEDLTVSFVKKKIGDELEEVPVVVETDRWWWLKKYGWLFLFPLSGLIVYVVLRATRRKKAVRAQSLKERALIALESLRKQELWKKDRINEHYIEFSFLLRSFLGARYELNLKERTTYETLLLLRTKGIPEPTLERIRKLLQESDMVKFAMGIPDEESIVLGMAYLEQLIVELSPLELIE